MDIYSTIIAILLHIFIILLSEGLLYYTFILPKVIKGLYNSIYKNLNDKFNTSFRLLVYFIYVWLYTSKKLYSESYDENNLISEQNDTNIIIFVVLLISIFLIIISIIIFVVFKLGRTIDWKFIGYSVCISVGLIAIYEIIFIYLIYTNLQINEYETLYNIMEKMNNDYYNPSLNYTNDINNFIENSKIDYLQNQNNKIEILKNNQNTLNIPLITKQ